MSSEVPICIAPHGTIYFGEFELRLSPPELLRNQTAIALQPNSLRVLALLVRSSGRLVTREELYRCVWGHTVIEFDQSLNFCISRIRRALGDSARAPTFIETVPRQGYRFIHPTRTRSTRSRQIRSLSRFGLLAALVGVGVTAGAWLNSVREYRGTTLESTSGLAMAQQNSSVAYLRGSAHLRRSRYFTDLVSASELFRTAIEETPTIPEAIPSLALAEATLAWRFGAREWVGRAEAQLKEAREQYSAHPRTQLALGIRMSAEEGKAAALPILERAAEDYPDDAEVLHQLGLGLAQTGELASATEMFRRARVAAPAWVEPTRQLARVFLMERRWDAAKRELTLMASMVPAEVIAERSLAFVRFLQGAHPREVLARLGEDLSDAEVGATVMMSPTLARGLAAYGEDVTRWELAELMVDPAYFHLHRGDQLRLSGAPGAEAHYHQARAALVDQGFGLESGADLKGPVGVRYALMAVSYAALGERVRARELADAVVEANPYALDALVGSAVRVMRAEVLVRLGSTDEAANQVKYLLTVPSLMSEELLSVDPFWAGVRARLTSE